MNLTLLSPNDISFSILWSLHNAYIVQTYSVNICRMNEWLRWWHTTSTLSYNQCSLNISYVKSKTQDLECGAWEGTAGQLWVPLTVQSLSRDTRKDNLTVTSGNQLCDFFPCGPLCGSEMGSNKSTWGPISRYKQTVTELVIIGSQSYVSHLNSDCSLVVK